MKIPRIHFEIIPKGLIGDIKQVLNIMKTLPHIYDANTVSGYSLWWNWYVKHESKKLSYRYGLLWLWIAYDDWAMNDTQGHITILNKHII